MGNVLGNRLAAAPLGAGAAASRTDNSQGFVLLSADTSSSRCLDAFTVALIQTSDRQRWYTSTMELQLASLSFCVACRSVPTLRLKIDGSTPRRLLATSTRVPRLRARAVTWERNSPATLRKLLYALANVEVFEFGRHFNSSIEDVVWPRRLRVLTLGNSFDQPIADVSWPPLLRRLNFGFRFNQPVDDVSWPPFLQQVAFGGFFNQPVSSVSWPLALHQLTFEGKFNQPISSVSWPPSLQQLTLSDDFNQPVASVSWPPSLKQLSFGMFFEETIAGVAWPALLRKICLGAFFNQPVSDVAWPASLEDITLGSLITDHVDGTCVLYSCFDQAIDNAMWPASLRRLTLGCDFSQSLSRLGTCMPNLEELTLLKERYSLLDDIEWPKRLKKLTVYAQSRGEFKRRAVPSSVEVAYLQIIDGLRFVCWKFNLRLSAFFLTFPQS